MTMKYFIDKVNIIHMYIHIIGIIDLYYNHHITVNSDEIEKWLHTFFEFLNPLSVLFCLLSCGVCNADINI